MVDSNTGRRSTLDLDDEAGLDYHFREEEFTFGPEATS